MSTVATVSLAIIAATCIIAVGAFLVLLVYLWRVLGRVEAMLALVQRALPGVLTDARAILVRIDNEIIGEVARTVTQVSTVVGSGVSAVEHAQSTARRITVGMILPQMASALGLLAAVRESLSWLRTGDGKKR